jgi:hypothetical protein
MHGSVIAKIVHAFILRAFLFGLAAAGCGWLYGCAGKVAVQGKLLF